MPLLVLAGASAVHASVSQTVRAASAVFEQPLNVAYERLSSFTQNYTATISNWTSRAAFARKVFEGCLTPPDMFGGLMRNHTTRYNYIYYNNYISNQFSGIVYTSIRLLEDHEGSWNSTQESKVHGCDSIFQLCDAYAKWDFKDTLCFLERPFVKLYSDDYLGMCKFFDDVAPCLKKGLDERVTHQQLETFIADGREELAGLQHEVDLWQGIANSAYSHYLWDLPLFLLFGVSTICTLSYIKCLSNSRNQAYTDFYEAAHSFEECCLTEEELCRLRYLAARLNISMPVSVETLIKNLEILTPTAKEKESLFWLYIHFKDMGVQDLFQHCILDKYISLKC